MKKINSKLINLAVLFITIAVFFSIFEVVLRLSDDSSKNISKWVETNDSRNYENMHNNVYSVSGVVYRINDDGLRADKDYPKTKKEDDLRIAVLGDSVAFGLGVDFNSTFGSLLEKYLLNSIDKSVEVINFGVPGYDSFADVAQLKIKALKYNPDIVILSFVMNDIEPSDIVFKSGESKKTCILPIFKLKVPCKVKDTIRDIKTVTFLYSKLKMAGSYFSDDYYAVSWGDGELYQKNIVNPIKEFNEVCFKENIKCAVVIFPLLKFNATYYPWAAQEKKLIEELDSLRMPFLALGSTYQQYLPEQIGASSSDILHPNILGHRVAAEEIAKFLKERFI